MKVGRVLAVGLLTVAGLSAPLGVSAAQAKPSGCVATSVVNSSLATAQSILKKHGCLPGKVRDGRHYVVLPQCVHGNQLGLIVNQNPTGTRLGPRQILRIWQGVSTMPSDPGCASMWAQPNAYDGYFIGTFTVTESESASYPVGNQTNLTFTVANGQITGSVSGTVVNGISTDAQISALGVQCPVGPGGLSFKNVGTAQADEVTCEGSFGNVQGRVSAGAFFGSR